MSSNRFDNAMRQHEKRSHQRMQKQTEGEVKAEGAAAKGSAKSEGPADARIDSNSKNEMRTLLAGTGPHDVPDSLIEEVRFVLETDSKQSIGSP